MQEENDDEWFSHLSQEDFENLEMEAREKLAERRNSASGTSPSTPATDSPLSPTKKRPFSQCSEGSSSQYASSKLTVVVKMFHDGLAKVAFQMPDNRDLVAALKNVPDHEWSHGAWIFPEDRAGEVERALKSIPNLKVQLVQEDGLHLDAASAVNGGDIGNTPAAEDACAAAADNDDPINEGRDPADAVTTAAAYDDDDDDDDDVDDDADNYDDADDDPTNEDFDMSDDDDPTHEDFDAADYEDHQHDDCEYDYECDCDFMQFWCCSRDRRFVVVVFQDEGSKIGTSSEFDQELVDAWKRIPGHEWVPARKVWLFPEQHLKDILLALRSLTGKTAEVELRPPLTWPDLAAEDELTTIKVLLFLTEDARIGARNPYNEMIKNACRAVPGRLWNKEEKMWTFPLSSFKELVQELHKISSPVVQIEARPPLVLPSIGGDNDLRLSPRCNLTENPSTLIDLTPPAIKDDAESSKTKRAKSNEDSPLPKVSATCAVCLEGIRDMYMYSTTCGHIFHEDCIRKAIRSQHRCPTCRCKLTDQMVHRLYFDAA